LTVDDYCAADQAVAAAKAAEAGVVAVFGHQAARRYPSADDLCHAGI
jgi:hypothetical protein